MSHERSVTRTLDLTSCRDMLGALERAIERLGEAKRREDVCDHGFYAALAAWHLKDWVWADLSRDDETRTKIANDIGISPQQLDQAKFDEFALSRCRDLRHCCIIATSSKHKFANVKSGDPTFAAGAAAMEAQWTNAAGDEVSWKNTEGKPVAWQVDARWELIILEDDQQIRAIDLFRGVEYFWTQLIYGYGIDEPQEQLPPEIADGT
jgi:hypothetical protein